MNPPARTPPPPPSPLRTWAIPLAAAAAFGTLFTLVENAGPLSPIDDRTLLAAAAIRGPTLNETILAVTQLGDIWAMTGLSLLTVVLLARIHVRSAIFFAAAMLGVLLHFGIKTLAARPRPTIVERVYEPGGQSFPSGHAMATFCFFVALALVVRRLRPEAMRAVLVAAAAFILLIGSTRVYLGVHYPTDVLGGWIAGTLWLSLLHAWYRREPAEA